MNLHVYVENFKVATRHALRDVGEIEKETIILALETALYHRESDIRKKQNSQLRDLLKIFGETEEDE